MTSREARIISGEEALAQFREGLTGPHALDLLRAASGRLLIQLPVGIGKSQWLVKIIERALDITEGYDLVVVLVPRRDVLDELQQRIPTTIEPVILEPRPSTQCGALDKAWMQYEKNGCGLLGRQDLCGKCPHRKSCSWPEQSGKRLNGKRLILGTQQYLVNETQIVARLQSNVGAKRSLLLLDESDLLLKAMNRLITKTDLERFVEIQRILLDNTLLPHSWMTELLTNSTILLQARDEDHRGAGWRFPQHELDWAVDMQRSGREKYGDNFRFIGQDLQQFSKSDIYSRSRLPNGDIGFAVSPDLGDEFIIFSGSIDPALARYRIDPNHADKPICSPFADLQFQHPGTRWFNIDSYEGAADRFAGNSNRILHFFAQKTVQNIRVGKRTVLICRKQFQIECQLRLTAMLHGMGVENPLIMIDDWSNKRSDDPATIPLITYGICGLNIFEHFDAAYCLTGYFVNAPVLANTIYDIEDSEHHYPIEIVSTRNPSRRSAKVKLPDNRQPILPHIVDSIFLQKEADVVIQAVGRVRPFTRPREIITFQFGGLHGAPITFSFDSLAAAREYFGIPTRRITDMQSRAAEVSELRTQGFTQKETAERLGISVRTIKRYEKSDSTPKLLSL